MPTLNNQITLKLDNEITGNSILWPLTNDSWEKWLSWVKNIELQLEDKVQTACSTF